MISRFAFVVLGFLITFSALGDDGSLSSDEPALGAQYQSSAKENFPKDLAARKLAFAKLDHDLQAPLAMVIISGKENEANEAFASAVDQYEKDHLGQVEILRYDTETNPEMASIVTSKIHPSILVIKNRIQTDQATVTKSFSFNNFMDKNFPKESLARFSQDIKSTATVLVDFSATWCGPCQALKRWLMAHQDKFIGKLKVVQYDVDEERSVKDGGTKNGIMNLFELESIPMIYVYKNGKIIGFREGFNEQSFTLLMSHIFPDLGF